MDEKHGLPPYTPLAESSALPQPHNIQLRARRSIRRSRALRFFGLACLGFLVLAQWQQIWRDEDKAPRLSLEQLNGDLQTCRKLRHKPQDPEGLGREKNARFIEGGRPTLIKNATIWVGEPIKGTSEKDARAGKGWEWINADVILENGLIQKVEKDITLNMVSKDAHLYNAHGRLLTAGIIDMHSHAGVYSLPALTGSADGNEMSDNITPWARSIDGLLPLDPQIQVIKSGGVTTSLVLPGSGNNMGGEAYLIKHAVGKPDGRKEISATDMLADPDRNWRFMKMACGENAKRAHGGIGKRPFSRMGESYDFRHAFEQAAELNQRQDDWCSKADAIGIENMEEYLPQEIAWESLGAALRGQVHINTHCYTIPDLEAMVDHTNEFKFPVRAFHHAHQTFLVPEILKRTWGGRPPSSAIFADNMYYKTEAYVGSEFAGKYLYDEGLTTVYVSDNPVLSAQHLVFEAGKGYHYGLPYHAAMASVTTAPADDLGMGKRLGKVKPGFDADIVVWDSDPLSVGAAPVQVWIDGTAQFEDPVELSKAGPGPLKIDESLQDIVEEPTAFDDAVFTGVHRVYLSDEKSFDGKDEETTTVVVSGGKIRCVGSCESELRTASADGVPVIKLSKGYVTRPFTGVGGTIGLNEIDAEVSTDNGPNPIAFTRAIDGLMLDSKKLRVANKYGVTRAISAPKFLGGASHHGTSVGFATDATLAIEKGAVFAHDVAVHYTLDLSVRGMTSYSGAYGTLRTKLIKAITSTNTITDPYSEEAYLKMVVDGKKVLALTISSADGISSALRIKSEVENLPSTSSTSPKIKMAIIGGAESWMVARELAEANVGVILSPMQAIAGVWDARRALPGVPLTNGTTIDWLIDAGVKTAIGLKEDWHIRDLGFAAGTAYRNSNGRLDERQALALVGSNAFDILGVANDRSMQIAEDDEHFAIFEGNPLEVGGKIKAVGSGRGKVAIFL